MFFQRGSRMKESEQNAGREDAPSSPSVTDVEFVDSFDRIETDPSSTVAPLPSVQHVARRQDAFQQRLQSEVEPNVAFTARSAAEPVQASRVPFAAKVLLGIVSVAVLVVLVIQAVSCAASQRDVANVPDGVGAPAVQSASEVADPASYLLLIGSDQELRTSRSGERSLPSYATASFLMLVRVDLSNAKMTLVSIPTDTLVDDDGSTRELGDLLADGADALRDAVSQFCGVDVAHYVVADKDGLSDVVEAFDGVQVDVPEGSDDSGSKSHSSTNGFAPGNQNMDEKDALTFAGISGGRASTYENCENQLALAQALVKKAISTDEARIAKVASAVEKGTLTDIRPEDVVTLIEDAGKLNGRLLSYEGVAPSYLYRGRSATALDEWRTMMQRVDAGLDPSGTSTIPATQAQDADLGAATNAASPTNYADLLEDARDRTSNLD